MKKVLKMKTEFYKYHGTGNDFILIDSRAQKLQLSVEQIALLCHRHYGIGADGLMLLEGAEGYDFRMVYYNSDGRESTMCGNGGRCITALAAHLGIIGTKANFVAIDGAHSAAINEDSTISLNMQDVKEITVGDGYAILNTGSPHYVVRVNDVKNTDVYTEGKKIRNRSEYQPDGINVNFAEMLNGKLSVRTYERGVEDETLSCGTGVVAAAIASTENNTGNFKISISTPGGELEVSFIKNTPASAIDVVLTGSATFVFKGEIEV